jgi:hypothetical protein
MLADGSRLGGNSASISVSTFVDGSPGVFFDPIPADFLQVGSSFFM